MDWNFIIFSLVKIAIVVGVVQGLVAYSVLAERKISAWIQDRVGPGMAAKLVVASAHKAWTARRKATPVLPETFVVEPT